MQFRALILGIVCAFFAGPASSVVIISSDKGGQIGPYYARYKQIRRTGERVVIDGVCFSACTIVLGLIPRNRLCATPNAVLGFHAAWAPGGWGRIGSSQEATRFLLDIYPAAVRRWIALRGGLSSEIILLRGRELAAFVQPCSGASSVVQRGGNRSLHPQPRPRAGDKIARPSSADSGTAR